MRDACPGSPRVLADRVTAVDAAIRQAGQDGAWPGAEQLQSRRLLTLSRYSSCTPLVRLPSTVSWSTVLYSYWRQLRQKELYAVIVTIISSDRSDDSYYFKTNGF